MRHFKLPLIASGVVLLLAIAVSIGGMAVILNSNDSDRVKDARAEKLGMGVGGATVMLMAPFWLYAAAQIGQDRRAAKSGRTRRKKSN